MNIISEATTTQRKLLAAMFFVASIPALYLPLIPILFSRVSSFWTLPLYAIAVFGSFTLLYFSAKALAWSKISHTHAIWIILAGQALTNTITAIVRYKGLSGKALLSIFTLGIVTIGKGGDFGLESLTFGWFALNIPIAMLFYYIIYRLEKKTCAEEDKNF